VAVCDDCFREFLHPLVHESIEKNERFEEKYGQLERWDWDYDSSTLTFSDGGVPKLRILVSVVGTTEGESWEWSWANGNFDPHTKRDIEKVREFGEANGYEKLTTAFLEADEHTGWEMTAIAVHVLQAPGSYRFPTEDGRCYLVYREIEELGEKVGLDLQGALEGTMQIAPDVDLTEPTGETWDAES
jgi:hypothetical protein